MTPADDITPWPLPGTGRVVLVGGTFDPPHRAHVDLAAAVRDRVEPRAGLIFVPAAASPFKRGLACTPAEHRVAMLRLAIGGMAHAAVWTDEVDRGVGGSPSYTVETLRRSGRVAPGCALRLLIGADQAAEFHRWREPREVRLLARPIVVLRDPCPTWTDLEHALRGSGYWSDSEIEAWDAETVAMEGGVDPVSSTRVRELVRLGGVDALPPGWVALPVQQYIAEQGLYRDGATS